jgi:hypothetical protein
VQTTGVPAHCPALLQTSFVVHALPSVHAVPAATIAWKHEPPVQLSTVQGFLSLQSRL